MIKVLGIIIIFCALFLLGVTVGYYAGKKDKSNDDC